MNKQGRARLIMTWLSCAFLSLLFIMSNSVAAESAYGSIEYYYENYCDSCHPEDELHSMLVGLTGKSYEQYQYAYYNVVQSDGYRHLEEALNKYGFSASEALLPVLIIDGHVYMGTKQIRELLPKYSIEQLDSTDSRIYYLYLPACESCAKADDYMNSIPDMITVHRGDYTFNSRVDIQKVDISADPQMAYALFDAYSVPESKRLAPILMSGMSYYQGVEQIDLFTRALIYQAAAVGTPIISAEPLIDAPSWGSVAAAGLIGGLNPCALSMLLLFLSMAANTPNGARLSAVFLVSKFVVYILIGAPLFTLFHLWNPVWLPITAKALLTAMSIVFIYMNIYDAVMVLRERYGKIRNQLPMSLRRGLHTRIQKSFEQPSVGLFLAAAGLGAMVAAGEFLCAGQVYLATIINLTQTGASYITGLIMLLVYCIAFLAPSAAVSVLAARGQSIIYLSEFLRKRLSIIKAATAVFFLVLLIIVWL
ncbi:hypothetical protein FACS1894184_02530 [Clostridia bacterium]|nr:hypothetical protein FACS1894184_02530 [Clostridia bacterium]